MDPTVYAELLKESGNQVLKNGNFSLAIRKYDEAIQILLQLYQWGVPPRDLAVLLCNKSNAFYSLGKWNEAFVAAKECLQWDPTYVKGYYRAGYSLLRLLQPYEAARMFFEGLRLVQRSQDQAPVADFLVGVFTTISSGGKHLDCGSLTPVSPLSSKKCKGQMIMKYVFIGLYEKMEQVPKLVQWLISIGASVETIGPYPLHALMRLCIQARENHLFRWLMDHKPEWKGRINQKDGDGCTVLHIVAAHSPGYLIKRQTEDVQMLLRFGADPTLLDRQSRSAVDVLKRNKNFKAIEKINSHLEKLAACSKHLADKVLALTSPLSSSPVKSVTWVWNRETQTKGCKIGSFAFLTVVCDLLSDSLVLGPFESLTSGLQSLLSLVLRKNDVAAKLSSGRQAASFHQLDTEGSFSFTEGFSNGDGPTSENDIFRKVLEQLVKYVNSGNQLLQKNFLKQEVVQRFLRLLSTLQAVRQLAASSDSVEMSLGSLISDLSRISGLVDPSVSLPVV
ncbi:TPR and ankyrin repeat-containing protein 1 [Saguinus oedipus]|uniref:TPR and ankyrin repeat-containing protein 1 n=1 Tax=Saguinus oedipus TaxID=9490 RepID=A0ABQ9TZD8_SAGOE|nr:TPR and ankyrin repeat-containing protein 1 [Saguinus oedipus]